MPDATSPLGSQPQPDETAEQRLKQLPLPLDPASIDLRVVTCSCQHGRGESSAEDQDDFGIPGCCGGHGVRLEVASGLEPLVLRLAAIASYGWTQDHRQDAEAFSEDFTYEIERQVTPSLAKWPPHEHGARVVSTWEGSQEQALDRAIAEGSA